MPNPLDVRGEVERLSATTRSMMDAAAAQFRSQVQRLINSSADPAELQSRLDRLTAEYEEKLRSLGEQLRLEIEQRFPSPPAPERRFYEEPRRRPPQSARRRLPKWPPDKRPSAGGVTVEPNKPSGLSGGAAAPLETD